MRCLFISDSQLVLMFVCPIISDLRFYGSCHPYCFQNYQPGFKLIGRFNYTYYILVNPIPDIENPFIVSKPHTFQSQVGGNILFHCKVSQVIKTPLGKNKTSLTQKSAGFGSSVTKPHEYFLIWWQYSLSLQGKLGY